MQAYERPMLSLRVLPDVAWLYRQHGAMVYRRAFRLLGNRSDAEEAAQEVFVRVMRTKSAYTGRGELLGWLHRITTRYCLNRLRDQRRRNGLFQLHVAPKLPMTAASAPAEMMMLRWLLGNADERQAQAAIYVHLDGMSHEAAAALMGVSKRTVGNLLERLQTFCDQQVAEPTTPVRPSRPALTARTAREGAAPRRRPPS